MGLHDDRARIVKMWNRAAEGWARHQLAFDTAASPVAARLVENARLQPGMRVLELASGLGDTGLLAAATVGPTGSVVLSDAAPAMLERLRQRSKGVAGVEVRELFLEALKFDTAAVDVVICRWGYMLAVDPGAALQETRRVLAPGGRVSLAAWAGPEANPWTGAPLPALLDRGLIPDPARIQGPHQFAWQDPAMIREALLGAGFFDPQIEQVDIEFVFGSVDEWWDTRLDLSPELTAAIAAISPEERDELTADLERELQPYLRSDGTLVLPGKTHVAVAEV